MNSYIYKISILLLAAFTALFLATACSDDPTGPGLEDDPTEVVGFVVEVEGVEIVRYQNGSYTFNSASAVEEFVFNDTFMLSTAYNGGNLTRTTADSEEIGGRRYFTIPVSVKFILDSGEIVELAQERVDGASGDVSGAELNPEGHYRMNVSWDASNDTRGANIEQHGSDQSWRFHIRADRVGSAGMTMRLNRCEDVISIESVPGDNHRVNQIRNCAVEDVTIFEASSPLPITIDDYDLAENSVYPHNRFERER
jgi:hypothetical protein